MEADCIEKNYKSITEDFRNLSTTLIHHHSQLLMNAKVFLVVITVQHSGKCLIDSYVTITDSSYLWYITLVPNVKPFAVFILFSKHIQPLMNTEMPSKDNYLFFNT